MLPGNKQMLIESLIIAFQYYAWTLAVATDSASDYTLWTVDEMARSLLFVDSFSKPWVAANMTKSVALPRKWKSDQHQSKSPSLFKRC